MNDCELPRVSALSRRQIELRAASFLNAYKRKCPDEADPLNIIQLLHFGEAEDMFDVDVVDALAGSKEGEYRPVDDVIVLEEVIYTNAGRGHVRPRFTVAHEIGHAVLHGTQLRVVHNAGFSIARYRQCDLKPYENPEWQANTFGAALLMPAEEVRLAIAPMTQNGWLRSRETAVETIERRFQVSRPAATNRLSDLKKMQMLK